MGKGAPGKRTNVTPPKKTEVVYSLADLINLIEVPDGIDLENLPFIDAATGRAVKARPSVNVTSTVTGQVEQLGYGKYQDTTLKGIRDFVKLFQNQSDLIRTVEISAVFESTGRKVPRGRAVITQGALAQAIADYLQA